MQGEYTVDSIPWDRLAAELRKRAKETRKPVSRLVAEAVREQEEARVRELMIRSYELRGRSCIMLEQIRTIAMERLGRYAGRVHGKTMEDVDRALHVTLGIRYGPVLL